MNAKRPKLKPRRNREKTDESALPPVWRTDSRPDPSTLSDAERANEFGRIIFRAIERRRAKAK